MLKLPEYIEQFVASHFQPRHVSRVVDEFIELASDGVGGSEYTRETVANLMVAREAGRLPTQLNYRGR